MQMNPTAQPDKIDDEFEKYAEETAQKRAEEAFLHANQLISKPALIERCKSELIKEFSTYRRRQNRGAELLVKALEALATSKPELFTDKVLAGIDLIASLPELMTKDEQNYRDSIAKGMSLQEFAGADDACMDVLYQAAKSLFEQKNFEDAVDVFAFLVGLNRNKFAFCLGLANSEYQLMRYKEALDIFTYICEGWPQSAACYLSISRCYKALNDPDKARAVLDTALYTIEGHPDYQKWKEIFTRENTSLK